MKRICLFILLLCGPAWAVSDSIQVQDTTGAPATSSTCHATLLTKGSSACDSTNFGSDNNNEGFYMDADARSIIRWPDITRIGIDSGITAAEADSGRLWLYTNSIAAGDSLVAVHYITEAWTEGTGTGAACPGTTAADSTDAAWFRRTGQSGVSHVSWTGAGCTGASQSTKTADTTKITGTGAFFTWIVSKAACSTWIADSTLNFGMVVFTTNAAGVAQFRTDDYTGTATQRPKFTLYWTDQTGAPSLGVGQTAIGVSSWGKP